MSSYFRCNNCGAYNLIGSPTCWQCYQQLFYNCPHCGAWVDNRYSHCPCCFSMLNWPNISKLVTRYYTNHLLERTYGNSRNKKIIWATMLASILIIGVTYLILSNPVNSNAIKLNEANALSTSRSYFESGKYAVVNQPQVTVSSLNSTLPADNVEPVQRVEPNTSLPTSTDDRIEIEMHSMSISPAPDSAGYVPKPSNYLQQLWPGWGHCSKGSCQAFTQP